MENSSGQGKSATIPHGVQGWSWGGLFLSWIWAIGNRTWIGLLALLPYVGLIMAIVLGIKGREWAWRNKCWNSVSHFKDVQRKWDLWGVGIAAAVMLAGLLAALIIPAVILDHVLVSRQISAWVAVDSGRDQFSLSELESPFEWTALYVFAPYTPTEVIEETLGRECQIAEGWNLQSRDDMNLAIFVRGSSRMCAEGWPRTDFDFDPALIGKALLPAAVIHINRTGEVPTLKLAESDASAELQPAAAALEASKTENAETESVVPADGGSR